jgi:histidinol dehydrogenase
MKIIYYRDLDEKFFEYNEYEETACVSDIIKKVKTHGDQALISISSEFGETIEAIELSETEKAQCLDRISSDIIDTLKKTIKNVRQFAHRQLDSLQKLEYTYKGSTLGHKLVPLERVGAYVPGGNYPLPSSAIMTAVPAKEAGVKEVIMCSPRIQDVTVVAALLSGVDRIFRVGGAQAIAAMAYGTETIPPVDKIVGPGNKYVTQAKKEVYGKCGIDFLAGPSEIMIIADESANKSYLAADLLSQAEHDVDASSVLITYNEKFAESVIKELTVQLENLETKEIASKALDNSFVIIVDSLDQAVEIANKKAPEHLQLCFDNAYRFINAFVNYGSLFVGNYSAEVFGDYCSGTNHVLPTNGVSRYSGGLSVFDFMKIQTYQIISEEAARNTLIPVAAHLAEIEGLIAHKKAALIRK